MASLELLVLLPGTHNEDVEIIKRKNICSKIFCKQQIYLCNFVLQSGDPSSCFVCRRAKCLLLTRASSMKCSKVCSPTRSFILLESSRTYRWRTRVLSYSPKGTARVNHPVAGSFLSYSLLHQSLFAAEELHGEPIVGRLEPCL